MEVQFKDLNLRISAFEDKGDFRSMEDGYALETVTNATTGQKSVLVAIMDGHGGDDAVNIVKQVLFEHIKHDIDFWNPERVLNSLGRGIARTQQEIATLAGFPIQAGTCLTLCVLRDRKVYTAHLGNTAVFAGTKRRNSKEYAVECITKAHTLADPDERQLVIDAGGQIGKWKGVDRVIWNQVTQGGSRMRRNTIVRRPYSFLSRGLGDLWSRCVTTGRLAISNVPDLLEYTLYPNVNKCLILASDGILNILSPLEAVEHVMKNETHFQHCPETFDYWTKHSRSLLWHCLETAWLSCTEAGNMVCIVIMISPTQDATTTRTRIKQIEQAQGSKICMGSKASRTEKNTSYAAQKGYLTDPTDNRPPDDGNGQICYSEFEREESDDEEEKEKQDKAKRVRKLRGDAESEHLHDQTSKVSETRGVAAVQQAGRHDEDSAEESLDGHRTLAKKKCLGEQGSETPEKKKRSKTDFSVKSKNKTDVSSVFDHLV